MESSTWSEDVSYVPCISEASSSLATGLTLAVFKSFLVRWMLKLEIPIDLTRPFSRSCISAPRPQLAWIFFAHLLHLGPGWRDIVRELDVEALLAVLLDGVLVLWDLTLWAVDLEVDLKSATNNTRHGHVRGSHGTHVPVHEV
jgi:hypothetical protein